MQVSTLSFFLIPSHIPHIHYLHFDPSSFFDVWKNDPLISLLQFGGASQRAQAP